MSVTEEHCWGQEVKKHLREIHFTIKFTTSFIFETLGVSQPATCSFADKWIPFHTIYENKISTLLPVLFKKNCCFYSLYLILKGKKKFTPGFQVTDFGFLQAKVIVFFLE